MTEAPVYRTEVGRGPPEEGGYFVVSYPEIPGCFGVGGTQVEAMEDGRRALIAVLDALKAVDRPPPEARGESA